MKVCCFIGHRNVVESNELIAMLIMCVENLIINENVGIFLFGSRSNFNDICYKIVTELKKKYSHIQRISYDCKSEKSFLIGENIYYEKIYKNLFNKDIQFCEFEKVIKLDKLNNAGKASYVERNFEMIKNSDFCVFYFNKNYKPLLRKKSKKSVVHYQPKSGTAIAYAFAEIKKKNIINLFN